MKELFPLRSTSVAIVNTTLTPTTLPPTTPSADENIQYEMKFDDWCLVLAFALIMLIGIMGNMLVIYVFGARKNRHRKTTEILIFYLGVIDLLSSLLNPPLNIYWLVNNYENWNFGWLGCKIIPVFGPVMTTASSWILLIFAIERYLAVVKPFSKLKPQTVKILCLASVCFSTGMYGHYINALTYIPSGYCYVPNVRLPEYGYPNCIFVIIRLVAFVSVFSITNIQIYRRLRSNEEKLFIDSSKECDRSRSKQIMRILSTMGIVFVILVFPRELLQLIYNMSQMVNPKGGIPYNSVVIKMNTLLKVMHTSNSCANIFIYAYMQESYRKHIRMVLKWFGCYKLKDRATQLKSNANHTET